MANKERGEIEIDVNGVPYTLRLDLNALAEMEQAYSPNGAVTFQECINRAERGSLSAIRALLWACLLAKHPGMKLSDVGTLMQQMGGLSGIAQKLKLAVAASMPTSEDVKTERAANPQKARSHGRGARLNSEPGASASGEASSGH